ncbi:MAG TPA: serine/threonine-protein kinase, partial [Gemmatimonadales bacterium]|nr:serine/threonine-protein kinase [Gemmatimonadales bacterium]
MPPEASDLTHTRIALGAADTPSGRTAGSSWSLPSDVLDEGVRRLRAVAWLYAVAYALAGPGIPLLFPDGRALLLAEPVLWVPAAVSIADALLLVALLGVKRIAARTKMWLGLAFEVLGSLGIAAAEYHHIVAPISYGDLGPGGFGLSWVAVWVMLFSVTVPVPPRLTLVSAALSLCSPAAVYAFGVHLGVNVPLDAGQFFFCLIFPYLIVLLMAYVAARVMYRLGAAVTEAREMGSYRLVQRLGKGGMGEVWRAQHQRLARPAAIKLIRPEVLGAQDAGSRDVLLQRFEREAQATAMLRSAHTLELYDFGVTDDGTFYHVMELLDGLDLRELVRRHGPVPSERVVYFLRQICDSLGEAHEAGLIHRDVKPANIYVCRYGRELDFIKVLDFGLVKHRHRQGAEDRDLTADQVAGGTPAYMSPEQALGDVQVDPRSDIYAVGCVAYWLLTGTAVFEGRTAMETIVMHVHT